MAAGRVLDDGRFVLLVLLSVLLLRAAMTPLYIDYGERVQPGFAVEYEHCDIEGTKPFDFNFYVCIGERLLQGKPLYTNYSITKDHYIGLLYPPAFPIMIASVIHIFGVNYISLKLLFIVLDAGVVLLVFLIARHLFGLGPANIAAALYAASFLPTISSAVIGNDDHAFVLFILLCVYFLLKGRRMLAGASLGVAVCFKVVSVLAIPAFVWYLHRTSGRNGMVVFGVSSLLAAGLILTPFLLTEGSNILNPFLQKDDHGIGGMSVLNVVRLSYGLPYHFLHSGTNVGDYAEGDPMNYEGRSVFVDALKMLASPMLLLGLVAYVLYIRRYRLRDEGLELVRNLTLLFVVVLLAYKMLNDLYFLWFLPLIIILYSKSAVFRLKSIIRGGLLCYAGVAIFAWSWSEGLFRPMSEVFLLDLVIVLVLAGSYIIYGAFERNKRLLFTLLALVAAIYQVMHAGPLRIFYFLVDSLVSPDFFRAATYYALLYVTSLATILSLFLLLWWMHNDFVRVRGDKKPDKA